MESRKEIEDDDISIEIMNQMTQLSLKKEKVGYVFDERMLLHKSFDQHVERPERAMSIYMNLHFKGLADKLIKLPSEEISEEELLNIHPKVYIDKISDLQYSTNKDGTKTERLKTEAKYQLCYDTYDNYFTYDSAKISAGSLLSACKHVAKGKVDSAFAIIRPPGHHASHTDCRGFCFFNNVALAADYLIRNFKLKVAIVDWDVHHGDGTQDIFYTKKNPLMISLHRHDKGVFYPGTGKYDHNGSLEGEGYTINIPWDTKVFPHSGGRSSIGDDEYYYAFEKIVVPVLLDYAPDIILVSCGFDAAENDPLGKMSLSPLGYAYMTSRLKKLADKIVVVLEGGYNLDSLSRCSESIIRTLLNDSCGFKNLLLKEEINKLPLNIFCLNEGYFSPNNYAVEQINNIKTHLETYWPRLKKIQTKTINNRKFNENNKDRESELSLVMGEKNFNSLFNLENFSENDFIKFRLGRSNQLSKSVKNKYKKINEENRTTTKDLLFRIQGIQLTQPSSNITSHDSQYLNWQGKDAIFDINRKDCSTLITKFLKFKSIKKSVLTKKLDEFIKEYENVFLANNIDTNNVDLIAFVVSDENEASTSKKKVKNTFQIKLNGLKDHSTLKDEKQVFYESLVNLANFVSDEILQ